MNLNSIIANRPVDTDLIVKFEISSQVVFFKADGDKLKMFSKRKNDWIETTYTLEDFSYPNTEHTVLFNK